MNNHNECDHVQQALVIIGKIPPPVGGVTVHLKRLMDHFVIRGFEYKFIYLRYSNLFKIFRAILNNRIFHLHTSNPFVRFLFLVIFSKLFRAKSIVTYHGNLGRFGRIYNYFDILSIMMADVPIVLNRESLIKAVKYNKSAIKISAFVRPAAFVPDPVIENIIYEFLNSGFRAAFCTNAYGMSVDASGSEIYGISFLLDFFRSHSDLALCFSDPSGQYSNYFRKKDVRIPDNVFIIDFSHDFLTVQNCCDCFIRATTTDGDSLSIGEALFLSKKVIASDCVTRPPGIEIYRTGDANDFENKVLKVLESQSQLDDIVTSLSKDTVEELLLVYKNIMLSRVQGPMH